VPTVLLVGLLLGQSPATESSDPQIARIRKALEQPHPLETTREVDRGDRPVFRLAVFGRKPDKPLWQDWSAVPSYIRPSMPLYHYEFLQMVTPEAFRAGVLYPGGSGVNIMPLLQAAGKGMIAIDRRRQEESARKEVRQALEDLKLVQEREQDVRTVIRSGVEGRMVIVRVTGKDGGPPRKLERADFTVLEDGAAQAVTVFTKNTDDPKTTRYELGYTPPPSKSGETTHIEIRVRGIRKKITYDFVTR
jgi:hypothetical protein